MHRVCFATASPAKFEEAVTLAGLKPQPTEAIKKLDNMKPKYVDFILQNGEEILRKKLNEIYEMRKNLSA